MTSIYTTHSSPPADSPISQKPADPQIDNTFDVAMMPKVARIKLWSRWLKRLTALLITGVGVVYLYVLLFMGWVLTSQIQNDLTQNPISWATGAGSSISLNVGEVRDHGMTIWLALPLTLYAFFMFVVTVFCLSRLFGLFRNFEKLQIFSLYNERLLKLFACSLALIITTRYVISWLTKIQLYFFENSLSIEKVTLKVVFGSGFLTDWMIVGIAFLVYWIYAVARLAYVETEHTV